MGGIIKGVYKKMVASQETSQDPAKVGSASAKQKKARAAAKRAKKARRKNR